MLIYTAKYLAWTTAEAFHSAAAGPSGKDIKSTFGQAVDSDKISKVSLKLFEFTAPLSILGPILTSPITEYALMVAKSEEVAEEARKTMSKLASTIEGAPGFHGITFGKHIGEEAIFLAVVGWDSVQVCVRCLSVVLAGQANAIPRLIKTQQILKRLEKLGNNFPKHSTLQICSTLRTYVSSVSLSAFSENYLYITNPPHSCN